MLAADLFGYGSDPNAGRNAVSAAKIWNPGTALWNSRHHHGFSLYLGPLCWWLNYRFQIFQISHGFNVPVMLPGAQPHRAR